VRHRNGRNVSPPYRSAGHRVECSPLPLGSALNAVRCVARDGMPHQPTEWPLLQDHSWAVSGPSGPSQGRRTTTKGHRRPPVLTYEIAGKPLRGGRLPVPGRRIQVVIALPSAGGMLNCDCMAHSSVWAGSWPSRPREDTIRWVYTRGYECDRIKGRGCIEWGRDCR
jgi:hypothetical protein